MKKLPGIAAMLVGLTVFVGLLGAQIAFFAARANSEVAFLRSEAVINAFEGETIQLLMPYVAIANQNDPLKGRVSGDALISEKNSPIQYEFEDLPAVVSNVNIGEATESGHYVVRMLSLDVTLPEAGTYRPTNFLITFADGMTETYPIGEWEIAVFPADEMGSLSVVDPFYPVSASSDSYVLAMKNNHDIAIWIGGIRLLGEDIKQSVSIQPGQSAELTFGRDVLAKKHQKSVLRIVRPVVSYTLNGKEMQWMPPVSHLGFQDIDYNVFVQEMSVSKQTRQALVAGTEPPSAQGHDPDIELVRVASVMSGYRADALINVLRQSQYQPAVVREWLAAETFKDFGFVYQDGEPMSKQDTLYVWALKMARHVQGTSAEAWVLSDAYPAEQMRDWLLNSEAWQQAPSTDLRGNAVPEDVMESLSLLRNARMGVEEPTE